MALLLDINDLGVRCYREGELLLESPGIAVVERELLLGTDAWRQARCQPLHTYSQFWSQLNTRPLQSGHPQVRHHGDLAYLHLQHMGTQLAEGLSGQDCVFALPGCMERESLALLLGIARQCQLNPVGLLDQALASALNLEQSPLWYAEMHLHQTVLSELTRVDGYLQRDRVEAIDEQGWWSLHQHLLKFFSNQFIAHTRFDPRHRADCEQRLFDAIPGWLQDCNSTPLLQCELDGQRLELDSASLQHSVQTFMAPLEHRLRGLPNLWLGDRLGRWSSLLLPQLPAQTLEPTQPGHNLAQLGRQFNSHPDGVRFMTRLAVPPPAHAPESTPEADAEAATHLLWRDRAYPLSGRYTLLASGEMRTGDHPGGLLWIQAGQINLGAEQAVIIRQPGEQIQLVPLAEAATLIRVQP